MKFLVISVSVCVIAATLCNGEAQIPDASYFDFAKIDHYPDNSCHSSADRSKVFCYIQNAPTIEKCIKLCTADPNRCRAMKFTKLNECVFYIDNRTLYRRHIPSSGRGRESRYESRPRPIPNMPIVKKFEIQLEIKYTTLKYSVIQDIILGGCDDFGVDNIKEWTYSNWNHGSDEADVITVTYTKKYDFTGLRVRWMGNMRSGTNCNGCGISYWFKFNGAQCSNPEKIDHAWYNGGQQRYEMRHGEFEGICYGLNAGDITIAFHVGRLSSGHAYGDAYTGWQTSNRIIAEEVDMRESSEPCIRHSIFNVRQKTARFEDGRDSGEFNQLTFDYKKLASDTGLRLKAYLNFRGIHGSHCIRYYFTMNGQECSDPYSIDTSVSWLHGSDTSQQLGSRSFEGICDGLPSGDYTIRLMLGACPWGHHHLDAHTGWGSSSRIIAEEVRYNRPGLPVYYTDGTYRQVSTFNLEHWNWYNLHDTNNNAVIVTVQYKKTSDLSGVRMLFNGVTRATTVRDRCTRWYFTFNGHECSDPGQLEGLHFEYSYEITEFNRIRPKTVSGICKGTSQGDLTAGEYSIALRVSDCETGHSHGHSVITGYQTRMTIMAEEVMYTEGPGHD